MQTEMRGYQKVRGVRRSEPSAVHLAGVGPSLAKSLCGRELNWRWESVAVDVRDMLALSTDIYCLNCLRIFEVALERLE